MKSICARIYKDFCHFLKANFYDNLPNFIFIVLKFFVI